VPPALSVCSRPVLHHRPRWLRLDEDVSRHILDDKHQDRDDTHECEQEPPLLAQWPHGHHTASTRALSATAAATADDRNRSAGADATECPAEAAG